ncbi:cell division protein ZipA C-terminal FtsZ-binding domain-containing protein [Halochromatium glycolicum]|uniref:Cell division protein ZipA n=1 Tax=Halochromatium glycolicum TaxID=85075 RepID=A0AAJ0XBR5_9GAMM|nr:cell division protein ZipA C-terminal FtsZ-binding domain-containing protein [Halochromatium glycolicum]MBK1707031.1 hypothetical protein [Halochromatium glycolicum]
MADQMDAATLRIILLILGILLLGAMYLWELRRSRERAEERSGYRRRAPRRKRREPRFDAQVGDQTEAGVERPRGADAIAAGRRRSGYGMFDAAPSAIEELDTGRDSAENSTETGTAKDRPSSRHASSAAASAQRWSAGGDTRAAPAASDGESLLVQLFVVADGQPFDGAAVEAAAEQQHLAPGEMAIYHRRSLEGPHAQARFSMANLVEPGTFPFDAMETFSTPGLALFAQFAGRPSDLMVYDELVQTARALADELGGEVLLPGRRRFDARAWERLRSKLLELINDRADSLTKGANRSDGVGSETAASTSRDGGLEGQSNAEAAGTEPSRRS